jgi:hypothetical protein
LDSVFENTIYSQSPASTTEGTSVITLDNVGLANVNGESPTLEIIARDDTIVATFALWIDASAVPSEAVV